MEIGSRASWGPRGPDGDATIGPANTVVLHHTVTATLPANATIAQEHAQMRNIEQIGISRFGRGSYHAVVFPSGRAYLMTSWNRRSPHTGGINSTSRGLAAAGNFEATPPTDAMIRTLAAIYAGRFAWPANAPLRPHRDFTATACPGRHLLARIAEIRAGGPPPPPPPPPEPEDEEMARLLRHPNGTVAVVGPGTAFVVLRTVVEIQALQGSGQVSGPTVQLADTLIWDTAVAVARRAGTLSE